VFLLAVALAAATPSASDHMVGFVHGSDLAARCGDNALQQSAFCFGFINAVYETVRAYETWLNIREICTPTNITLVDMRNAVVDHLKRVPSDGGGQGASVVLIALKEKWPCA
jgi:hypothetical protein